jgi:nucleoside-diphosphate-sugar epimerase
MKSVAIVGLGWLGLPLALHLKELGWCVKGSKQSPEDAQKLHQLGIETYPFSLSEEMMSLPDHIRPLFNVDALIITLPPSSFSSQQYCEYLAFLINQAKKQGVQHLIFTSSTSVFSNISGQFDEGAQLSAETEIGKTLIQAEQCLFQSEISYCDVLRLAGLIGKQRHPVKFLAGKCNLKQGNSPVNLVHLEDCIQAITALLMNPNGLRTYHLCAPFVTQFVGDVNVFHGHIDQGNLVIGEFAHNLQTHSNATHAVNNQSATAYIRPYELTLSRESHNALASGTIRHINAIGFIVRIEVESSQTEQPIEVILTKENYLNAQYKIGDQVYLVPDKLNLFQEMNI